MFDKSSTIFFVQVKLKFLQFKIFTFLYSNNSSLILISYPNKSPFISTVQLNNALNSKKIETYIFRRNKKVKPSQIPATDKCYSNSRLTTPQIIQLFRLSVCTVGASFISAGFLRSFSRKHSTIVMYLLLQLIHSTPSVTNKSICLPHPPSSRARHSFTL